MANFIKYIMDSWHAGRNILWSLWSQAKTSLRLSAWHAGMANLIKYVMDSWYASKTKRMANLVKYVMDSWHAGRNILWSLWSQAKTSLRLSAWHAGMANLIKYVMDSWYASKTKRMANLVKYVMDSWHAGNIKLLSLWSQAWQSQDYNDMKFIFVWQFLKLFDDNGE